MKLKHCHHHHPNNLSTFTGMDLENKTESKSRHRPWKINSNVAIAILSRNALYVLSTTVHRSRRARYKTRMMSKTSRPTKNAATTTTIPLLFPLVITHYTSAFSSLLYNESGNVSLVVTKGATFQALKWASKINYMFSSMASRREELSNVESGS